MLTSLLKFLVRRTSESTFCLIIWLAQYMNPKDLRDCANYLEAVASDIEYRTNNQK